MTSFSYLVSNVNNNQHKISSLTVYNMSYFRVYDFLRIGGGVGVGIAPFGGQFPFSKILPMIFVIYTIFYVRKSLTEKINIWCRPIYKAHRTIYADGSYLVYTGNT